VCRRRRRIAVVIRCLCWCRRRRCIAVVVRCLCVCRQPLYCVLLPCIAIVVCCCVDTKVRLCHDIVLSRVDGRVETRCGRVLATRGGMSHITLSFSALMGNVQWNRYTDQSKTIKGMGWSKKLLKNNCW
jgi:hypothetical protein